MVNKITVLLGLSLLVLVDARPRAPGSVTRHYYIAAEDTVWDFAPSTFDLIHSDMLPPNLRAADARRRMKTRYIEYTDSSFTTPQPQPPWLGILGPIIRAEVGDTVVVDFLNRSARPHGMHPHGLRYDKAHEGALYVPFGAGARIRPGGRFRYVWVADQESGPVPGGGGPSSVVWMYHSHVDEPEETNLGLMGPIIVTARGKAKPGGSPKDVDREFVALFMIFDELQGNPEGFVYTINGYAFENLPGLTMTRGQLVRWHLLGMGDEVDLHTAHWHGQSVRRGDRYTDVVELLPASMVSVDMTASNVGSWLFHCQVAEHMENGMAATFTIHEPVRACPLELRPDFWSTPGRFAVTVANRAAKPLVGLRLRVEYFSRTVNNDRGFPDEWTWTERIPGGAEQTLELQTFFEEQHLTGYFHSQEIIGWAVYPTRIEYGDGTVWTPRDRGECFAVSWRDNVHPTLEALPPLQPALELPEDYKRLPRRLRR
jgi:hypothetical protein